MRVFTTSTIICILFLISLPSYGQEFRSLINASYYDLSPGQSLPVSNSNDLAVVYFVHEPQSGSNEYTVLDATLLSSFTPSGDWVPSSYGYYLNLPDNKRAWVCVCDASTIFCRTSNLRASLKTGIFNVLQSRGLGTIAERASFISLLKSSIAPTPVIFVHFIKPWVVIGFAIFLSLPMWWVVKRALR